MPGSQKLKAVKAAIREATQATEGEAHSVDAQGAVTL